MVYGKKLNMLETSMSSVPCDERLCINLANKLIQEYHIHPGIIDSVKDIKFDLVLSLFERITGQTIPDLLKSEFYDEETHNFQAMIDTLSMDVLGISLSHITGEDITSGNLASIYNLLEVLEAVSNHLKSSNSRRFRSHKKDGSSSMNVPIDKHTTDGASHIKDQRSSHTVTTASSRSCNRRPKTTSPKMRNLKRISSSENSCSSTYPTSSSEALTYKAKILHNAHMKDPIPHSVSLESVKRFAGKISSTNRSENQHKISKKTFSDKGISREEHVAPEIPVLKRKISKLSDRRKNIKPLKESLKIPQYSSLKRPMSRTPLKVSNKSFLLPYKLRRRSSKSNLPKTFQSKNIATSRVKKTSLEKKPGLIQELLEEFPGIKIPPSILNRVNTKYENHLVTMHKQVKTCLLKKPKMQIQLDGALRKQLAQLELIKKDIQKHRYLKEVQQNKQNENKINYLLRDSRLQSAKIKEYYREFHKEMYKKMQKRNFSEEKIFENAFQQALTAQQEEVEQLCKNVIDAHENDAEQHQKYLDALENFYVTQFGTLSEAIEMEHKEVKKSEKAKQQAKSKLEREFKDHLKHEIREIQNKILHLTDDVHFREVDAERFITRVKRR